MYNFIHINNNKRNLYVLILTNRKKNKICSYFNFNFFFIYSIGKYS